MKNIEIKILNPEVIAEAEQMQIFAARLTQKGHKIKSMDDLTELYDKPYTPELVGKISEMPHNTLRQFSMINVAVVGASRRFLAQITRRRIGVTFVSASLQYSDYSGEADFTVPYSIIEKGQKAIDYFLKICKDAMEAYSDFITTGIDNDAAGYVAPQALSNILIISATPQAWLEMISQRVCRRNTAETRYVMLRIWQELFALNPIIFAPKLAGPDCISKNKCREGDMACDNPHWITRSEPTEIIGDDFPALF